MKTKIKLLDLTLIGLLYAGGAATPGFAQQATASSTDDLLDHLRDVSQQPAAAGSGAPVQQATASTYPSASTRCTDDACSSTEDLLAHLRGRENPSAYANVHPIVPPSPATRTAGNANALAPPASASASAIRVMPKKKAVLLVSQPVRASDAGTPAPPAAVVRDKAHVTVPPPAVAAKLPNVSEPVHRAVATSLEATATIPAPRAPDAIVAANSAVIEPRKTSLEHVSGSSSVAWHAPVAHHVPAHVAAAAPADLAGAAPGHPSPGPQTPAAVIDPDDRAIVPRQSSFHRATGTAGSPASQAPAAGRPHSNGVMEKDLASQRAPAQAVSIASATPSKPLPLPPPAPVVVPNMDATVPRKPAVGSQSTAIAVTQSAVSDLPHVPLAAPLLPTPVAMADKSVIVPRKVSVGTVAGVGAVAAQPPVAVPAPVVPPPAVPAPGVASGIDTTDTHKPSTAVAASAAPAVLHAPVSGGLSSARAVEQQTMLANITPNVVSPLPPPQSPDSVISASGHVMVPSTPVASTATPVAGFASPAPTIASVSSDSVAADQVALVSVPGGPSASPSPWKTSATDTSGKGADCNDSGCSSAEGMLFQVNTLGEEQPVVLGNSKAELQANRRVDITTPQAAASPGVAKINGHFSIDLPDGGVVWATEDPTLSQPSLNVQAGGSVPFDNGRILKPVQFQGYTNYSSFMSRIEVRIYRGDDDDLVTPLAVLHMPLAGVTKVEWNGALPAGLNLRAGDTLKYVTRAYSADGNFDETIAQSLQLQTPKDYERGAQQTRDQAQKALGLSLDTAQAQMLKLQSTVFGQNALRLQNIRIYGSRVRIYGRDVPRDYTMKINGEDFPIDQKRKFVAEFLEPIGTHSYTVSMKPPSAPAVEKTLDVNVTGKYSFLVAMADATVSKNSSSGSVSSEASTESSKDNFVSDGRLAFYSKTKIDGKYLITAQADTTDRDVHQIFNGFFKADSNPQDIFRNLDPNLFYPTLGDDSTTYRDVDTQGRFYLRVDWDQNQALWGNYATGFTNTQYAQYNRDLYGAALSWRSHDATQLGDAKTQVKVFGSQAQSVAGHNEFLGTGGSLYYMHQTDILPGSEVVTVQVRDHTTGRIMSNTTMSRGSDYEIDNLQGRIILTKPLAQITRNGITSITRDAPLGGYDQILLVDYEYTPVGLNTSNVTGGINGKQWFGEHLAVGGTYVNEGRDSGDYTLEGANVTLQQGNGTYLKVEKTHSQSAVAPILYSDNGGFSFLQKNPTIGPQSGNAEAVEARANFHELGLTQNEWTVGAWWRNVDPGFSAVSFDTGSQIREYGANFLGYVTKNFSLYGQYSYAENNGEVLKQNQLTAQWRFDEVSQIGFELRQLSETNLAGTTVNPMLAAVSYDYRWSPSLDLYTIGQYTVNDDHGAYPKNNLATVGAKYLFASRSSVGAELSDGSRGHGALINADYQLTTDHDLYSTYRYTTDSTAPDPLFNPDQQAGWTIGQRWRLSNQVNVYNESQYLKDPTLQNASGLANTFGMDFYPAVGWNLGFTLQEGRLDAVDGSVSRHAYSVSGGRTDERTDWVSKLEYRQDTGAEQRNQWATTNRLLYKINEDWRLAVNANYANTTDDIDTAYGARLAEINTGFAFRPHDNTRWALFGRYTYLYDLASPGQVSGNIPTVNNPQGFVNTLDTSSDNYDQRTQVVSLEGIYRLDDRWEVASKVADRWGDYRTGRATGAWLSSRADFVSGQLRYHLIAKWDALVEYRWLGVQDGGDQKGFLAGIDREVGQNFKIGIGYNFTNFSDDLTHVKYDNKGWFLNMTGYY